MGELHNCPECGQLFVYLGRYICPKCIEKDEEDFKTVRKYIRKHAGATIIEVAEATGIDEEKILRYLKEGRLLSRGLASSAILYCERCGERIEAGRYCESCAFELDSGLRQTAQASKKESALRERLGRERMHIKDKDRLPK